MSLHVSRKQVSFLPEVQEFELETEEAAFSASKAEVLFMFAHLHAARAPACQAYQVQLSPLQNKFNLALQKLFLTATAGSTPSCDLRSNTGLWLILACACACRGER